MAAYIFSKKKIFVKNKWRANLIYQKMCDRKDSKARNIFKTAITERYLKFQKVNSEVILHENLFKSQKEYLLSFPINSIR